MNETIIISILDVVITAREMAESKEILDFKFGQGDW